jgi:shikimate dehydrogenase
VSKLFTIFGNPVSHSISPLIHNYTIKSLGIKGCYTRTLLEDPKEFKEIFIKSEFDAANITVPFKETAYESCDEVKGIANDIKAVNTIVQKNGKLTGYNTDAPGFYESIKEFKNVKTALILGAGGTAKAIATILKSKGIKPTVLNRSENRINYFLDNGFEAFSWGNFKEKKYDIIINTTSAGLKDTALPLDKNLLISLVKKSNYCIDVIYGKLTPFLELAKKANKPYKDGSDMLLYQAVLAFEIFFDRQHKKDEIEKHMRYVFLHLLNI